jgi:hypothetical protein
VGWERAQPSRTATLLPGIPVFTAMLSALLFGHATPDPVDLLCSDGEFQERTPDLAPGTYRLGLSRLFQASAAGV